MATNIKSPPYSVADPAFPIGGMLPLGGGVDLRCRHFLVKMYAKMKERIGFHRGWHAPSMPP